MSGILKFKYWDGEKMYGPFHLFDCYDDYGRPHNGFCRMFDENCVLTSPGKCDKNGRLIFSGDIVKFPSGKLTPIKKGEKAATVHVDKDGIEYKKEPNNIGVVHNMGNAFYVGAINLKIKKYYGIIDYQQHLGADNDIEVIGNIYENPELLEQ